jgi:4,5:9,10-diseco-3-hydroxy-5,9,17-trioxoandrosta-1(10),2-diene-4-oate hydrolase
MIKVGTIKTRYWMEGEGYPVILIHGISNSIEDWLLNFEDIAEQYQVYALDLIGHGRTDKPLSASYGIQDLARFVVDFMDTMNIGCAHIVGHSLGGAIALTMAIHYPSYVNKLVLVDSGGLGQECSIVLRLVSLPGLGELLGTLFMQGSLEKRISMQRESWPDAEIVPDEMIRLKYDATLWQDISKSYFKTLRAITNFWGLRKSVYMPILQHLPSLANPVLVVWGEQDNMLPVSQTQIVKDKVPHARVEIFENCKHDPMVVNPQRFNHLILKFLNE